ncbi:uncharacterized protein L3040_001621 [Drepanopeziza brunnea f. sp. 'multigermtubi']|uniref:uncharacterized protein n=1 Tax=Drepanopeziza brunnea f. sp. 'multigermtubi' TaxID=698441 RepID=UPI00239C1D87|nr:hypothetical protein L3040_001621 [Drepanopeziza brunnea f. sp. 'multigermtubi']
MWVSQVRHLRSCDLRSPFADLDVGSRRALCAQRSNKHGFFDIDTVPRSISDWVHHTPFVLFIFELCETELEGS